MDNQERPFEPWEKLKQHSDKVKRRLQKILKVRRSPTASPWPPHHLPSFIRFAMSQLPWPLPLPSLISLFPQCPVSLPSPTRALSSFLLSLSLDSCLLSISLKASLDLVHFLSQRFQCPLSFLPAQLSANRCFLISLSTDQHDRSVLRTELRRDSRSE